MKLLLFSLLLFCAYVTSGTNWYVSVSGNDLNTGVIDSRFRTIQKAHDVAQPGDSIIVGDGRYTNGNEYFLQITHTGTAGHPIVYKSEHKWGAILDGDLTDDKVFESSYGIRVGNNASYIVIEDFEIKNFILCGIFSNEFPATSHYIKVEGCKIHDINRSSSDYIYGLCAIYLTRGSSYWNITRNLMYNIGKVGPDSEWLNLDHAVYTGESPDRSTAPHHIRVTYNIIWGCSGHALSIGSDNDLYANNVIAWTHETHYYGLNNPAVGTGFVLSDAGCKNDSAINNVFFQPSLNSEGQPWAIGSWGVYEGHVIKNNVVYGGRMFESGEYTANPSVHIAALKGSNYGRTDCENSEINPLFVQAVRGDTIPVLNFSLQENSPLKNLGVSIVGLTKDFYGNPIVGSPDIGAIEYQSIIPTPLPTTPRPIMIRSKYIVHKGKVIYF